VAIDADTGKLRWYHQEFPDDSGIRFRIRSYTVRPGSSGPDEESFWRMNKSGLTFVLEPGTGEVIRAFLCRKYKPDFRYYGRWQTSRAQRTELGKPVNVCPCCSAKSWIRWLLARTGFLYAPLIEMSSITANRRAPVRRFRANGMFDRPAAEPLHVRACRRMDPLPASAFGAWLLNTR